MKKVIFYKKVFFSWEEHDTINLIFLCGMEKPMVKKAIWKMILIVFVLPLGAALLFTALHCFFNNYYFEWYWVMEWMCNLPEVLAYYVVYASVFASFGVMAFFIFFQKAGQAVLVSAIFVITAGLFPLLRYVVRHFFYLSVYSEAVMQDIFITDSETSLILLGYVAIFLLIVLLERAFYQWILKEKPMRTGRMFSPKNPVGPAALIFFAALAVVSTLMFVTGGEYETENVLSLLLEYVIDLGGFSAAAFGASIAARYVDSVSKTGLT